MWGQKKRKALPAALVLLCVAGAWISGELVKDHAGPWPSSKAAPTLFARLCGTGPGGESGCAAVLDSKWSAVDVNVPVLTRALTIQRSRVVVPVAFLGLAYYVFLGVWFAFAGRPRPWGRWWYLVPLSSVAGGAVGSITLVWVMVFEIEARCWWCLLTHVINGLLLVGTLCLWPRQAARTVERSIVRSKNNPAAYTRATLTPSAALKTMGFAVLLIVGLWFYRGAKLDIRREVAKLLPYKEFVDQRTNDPAFLLREYYAQPQRTIPPESRNGDHSTGDTSPTLVVFSDFQCPQCACFAGNWKKQLEPRWRGSLRVSFRHFPLCRECNGTVAREIHPEACQASYAAEAARSQGGEQAFWRMHDLLFARGRRLGDSRYAELATTIGLDGERLVADMQSEAVRQAVTTDVALAAELDVKGTPTVYLDGRLVPQLCLYNPLFWEAISGEWTSDTGVALSCQVGEASSNATDVRAMVAVGEPNG